MAEQLLTEDALTNETAAPSVEDTTPEVVGEVDGGSAQVNQDVVPAARFNGLMGRLSQEIAQRKKLEQQLEQLISHKEQPPVAESQRADELYTLLMEERMESAKSKVLKDYPELEGFTDLIVGESPQDILEVGKVLGTRLRAKLTTTTGETKVETTTETSPKEEPVVEDTEVPVVGGGAQFDGDASIDERLTSAIKKGSFADFLQAKWEKAVASGEVEGLAS